MKFHEIFQISKMEFRNLILCQHIDDSVSLNHFECDKNSKDNVDSSFQGKYDCGLVQQEK